MSFYGFICNGEKDIVFNSSLTLLKSLFPLRAKIRNIEETEEARQRLIEERRRKKDQISEFVPTNMAVNFVQHNRCKIIRYTLVAVKSVLIPHHEAGNKSNSLNLLFIPRAMQ